jgi:TetR/AcrR family transcriptional regulator, ethionamide resistance regulator
MAQQPAAGQPPGTGARRPSRRKGDRTGRAILEAAGALLADRHISEVTVDEIAKGAGISRSAFYFHYESREAVLYALTEQITEELYESGTAWFRRTDESPREATHRAVARTVALWREHAPVLRASVRARDTDPRLRAFWSETGRRFIAATAEQIERERQAGFAIAGPPGARRLATVLITMNEQACFNHTQTRHTRAADDEFVDTLVIIWIRSIYGDTYGEPV